MRPQPRNRLVSLPKSMAPRKIAAPAGPAALASVACRLCEKSFAFLHVGFVVY